MFISQLPQLAFSAIDERVGSFTGGCGVRPTALAGDAAEGLLSHVGDVLTFNSRLSDTSIESQSEVGSLDMLSVYDKKKRKAQG